jgi:hypothetical protein
MSLIYVGRSGEVGTRIKQHSKGTVHQSPIRKWVSSEWDELVASIPHRTAKGKPYRRKSTGKELEGEVSKYMQEGSWKAIPCKDDREAHDFEWYCVETLKPIVPDKTCKPLRKESSAGNKSLLDQLPDVAGRDQVRGSGVYFFYHDELPKDWRERQRLQDLQSESTADMDKGRCCSMAGSWRFVLGVVLLVGIVAVTLKWLGSTPRSLPSSNDR